MSRLCLDISAYSHFKRGDAKVIELIDSADWIGVPTIVLGELSIGFLLGNKTGPNKTELNQFLGNPVVELLNVDRETADIYAEIFVTLRRAGTPVPMNDIWIAALAARFGATVLTYDTHFKLISRIGCIVL
jgi:tRNA(fMet)-specific endonuclease VapC